MGPSQGASDRPGYRLLIAESQRDPGIIPPGLLSSPEPQLRRAATRVVARIGAEATVALLERVLMDEDPQVAVWAAFGLGGMCRAPNVNASEVERALAIRAARAVVASEQGETEFTSLDYAIARSLGRCATDGAERTLTAWLELGGARARVAALGLGDIASRKKTLYDQTQSALFSAASGDARVREALYPLGKLELRERRSQHRLLEVSRTHLVEPGASRIFAIRAIARAGRGAEAELERVLLSSSGFEVPERIEAAQELAKLGRAGHQALHRAVGALVPSADPSIIGLLETPSFGLLSTLLGALDDSTAEIAGSPARARLFSLARLPIPPGATPWLTQRIVQLRCAAAAILVNGSPDDPVLTACDPVPRGETFELAQLRVLNRRAIRGRRLALWHSLVQSPHVRVREGALAQLGAHPEIEGAPERLAEGLDSAVPGLVATAASVIASHPERAFARSATPSNTQDTSQPIPVARLAQAITAALDKTWPPDGGSVLGAVAEAAGAMRLGTARQRIERLCQSPEAWLRQRASRALSWFSGANVLCAGPVPPRQPAEEINRIMDKSETIAVSVGPVAVRIRLDPRTAPIATTRISELFRSGFYDGLAVHRVVPGQLVQFGDPGGDGFGGAGITHAPLPLEAAPIELEPGDVAVASPGTDTGSSQVFVVFSRQPNWDGEYSIIGRAEGAWLTVAEGDRIARASRE